MGLKLAVGIVQGQAKRACGRRPVNEAAQVTGQHWSAAALAGCTTMVDTRATVQPLGMQGI